MSIKPRKITCKVCEKEKNHYAKGLCNYCYADQDQKKRRAKARAKRETKGYSSKGNGLGYIKKRIKPVATKRQKQISKYYPLRNKYLEAHQVCEVDDCNNYSTNLHHKKGRENEMLINVEFFMACCSDCHPKRIHETNVKWAKKMGYLLLK